MNRAGLAIGAVERGIAKITPNQPMNTDAQTAVLRLPFVRRSGAFRSAPRKLSPRRLSVFR